MKMKSAVLASALVAVSAAFADIYQDGDIYGSWFTTTPESSTAIDTELNEPIFVSGDTLANASDGYAVTAEVSIVIHSTCPSVPTAITVDSTPVSPKGSICAAYDGNTAKWYGLSSSGWVVLEGLETPTEGSHTLVTEFDDKGDGVHNVRYWVDGVSSVWLTSGHKNALQKVGLAGTGSYTKVVGLLVNAWTGSSIEAVPITISKAMLANMGVSTENTTPGAIVTALTTPEKNGIAKWANYVLGINGTNPANKPFAAPVQNSTDDTLTFKLGGVSANTDVADVTYAIETLESPGDTSGTLSDYVAAGTDKTITLEPSKVQYYRVKVQIDAKSN